MKKHSLVVFFTAACLTGFMGQLAAVGQTTNSAWNVTAINTLSAGKIKDAGTNSATAVFLSDGTFSVLVGTNEFGGTYTNTTKSLTVTFNAGAVTGLESNAVDFIAARVPAGVTLSIKSSKFSKIQVKNGVPVKVSDKISGKGSETVGGKTRSKSFTFTYLLTDWVLSSGANF